MSYGFKVFADEALLLPKASIDTPMSGTTVKGNIPVNGWFLDGNGVSKIEVLVDGKTIGEAKYGDFRPDVQNCIRNTKMQTQDTNTP